MPLDVSQYYIEITAIHGYHEVWLVEREDENNLFGTIVHSSTNPELIGKPFSAPKEDLSKGIDDKDDGLNIKIDFTLQMPELLGVHLNSTGK